MCDSKYFVVLEGRQRGIFDTWRDCESQVSGHSNPSFRFFKTREEAEACITKYTEKKKKKAEIEDDQLVAASMLISMRDQLELEKNKEVKCRGKRVRKSIGISVVGLVHHLKESRVPIAAIGIHFYDSNLYSDVSAPILGISNEISLTFYVIMRVIMMVDTSEDILILTESRYCIEATKSTQTTKGQHSILVNEIRSLISKRTGKTTFEWTTSDLNKKAHELSRKGALRILTKPN